eukprot:scaffold3315_cov62-Phaeocystis_antarctica.AAC.2
MGAALLASAASAMRRAPVRVVAETAETTLGASTGRISIWLMRNSDFITTLKSARALHHQSRQYRGREGEANHTHTPRYLPHPEATAATAASVMLQPRQ